MIDYAPLAFRVEAMRPEDIGAVMDIEQVSFSAPWSARAYDYELHYNEMAHYFVVRPQYNPPVMAPRGNNGSDSNQRPPLWRRVFTRNKLTRVAELQRPPIVGYGGMWLMVDEAHISTLASHPEWRGQGVGELLLLAMIDRAAEIGAQVVTLEVRVTNNVAQTLYRKYGFQVAGRRKGYYSDNGEDALIMSTPRVTAAAFNRRLQELRAALFKRLARPAVLKADA
jgi:ribosomal-protein-alanine N-acetyltransferase